MSDQTKKVFLAGVGLAQSVVDWVKKEVDELIQKGEKADGKAPNAAKSVYERVEKNIEEIKDLFTPFSKDDDKDQKIEKLSQEVEKLKTELNKMKKDN